MFSTHREKKKKEKPLVENQYKGFHIFHTTNQPANIYTYMNTVILVNFTTSQIEKKNTERKKIKRMWKNIKSFIFFPHIDNDQNRKENKKEYVIVLYHIPPKLIKKIKRNIKKKQDKAIWT